MVNKYHLVKEERNLYKAVFGNTHAYMIRKIRYPAAAVSARATMMRIPIPAFLVLP